MDPIVIIGSGLAGYSVARELRKLDDGVPIAILSRDDASVYSKPMLSNAMASGKDAGNLASSTAEQMARQLGAEIVPWAEVDAVDPARRMVMSNGQALGYSKLVLAVGADPVRPVLEGTGADGVLSVNDLSGYGRFRDALSDTKRIAILGAGLIGCEFANDLAIGGYEGKMIDPAPYPLGHLVPEAAGRAMQQGLADLGVDWHKTPAVPVVVTPPLPGIPGEWHIEVEPDGVRALFHEPNGRLKGFALTGALVPGKNALLSQVSPWLQPELEPA